MALTQNAKTGRSVDPWNPRPFKTRPYRAIVFFPHSAACCSWMKLSVMPAM